MPETVTDSLEQILADTREEAAILEQNHAAFSVARLRTLLDDITDAASEFLTWVSEKEAMIRSGHKEPWFRKRFPEWHRQGHARFNAKRPRERQYRLLVVPLDHDMESVRADARRTAREDSVA